MSSDLRAQRLADLLHAASVLDRAGMCTATDGNFSARLDQDTVLITRAAIEKRGLTDQSFLSIGLADVRPDFVSSEWFLHRLLYVARPDLGCVLHVHAPYLTTFASAHLVPPVSLLAESYQTVGEIAFVPFSRPGSRGLGERMLETSATAMVYLLANHGAVTVGISVTDALHRLERAEFLSRVAWQSAALGRGIPLSPQQLTELDQAGSC